MLRRLAPPLLFSALCLTAAASAAVVTSTPGAEAGALFSSSMAPLTAPTAPLPPQHATPLAPQEAAAPAEQPSAPSPRADRQTSRGDAGIDPSPLALLGLGLLTLAVVRRKTSRR